MYFLLQPLQKGKALGLKVKRMRVKRQQCASLNITVGMKITRCGHEPIYKNFTIGKDGFSLHPFQRCFWKDDTISLHGKTYRWIGEKWTKIFLLSI